MKIFIVIAFMTVFLAGCGTADKMKAGWTGHATQCIGGVEYIQFTSGASVAYDVNSQVKTCK